MENPVINEIQNDSINLEKLNEQIEFYFSDSNLFTDKYLSKQILTNNEGYVDLTIFLNFNKIRQILNEIEDFQKKRDILINAIKISKILKLNISENKVKRIFPFKKNENLIHDVNGRMIYLENFPLSYNQEDIKRIFQVCGDIECVSIPKFTETKVNKGYAFITFKEVKGSQVAISYFHNSIPEQLLNENKLKGKIMPLRVISKEKWLDYKEKFKEIKKDFLGSKSYDVPAKKVKLETQEYDSPHQYPLNCLLRLSNVEFSKFSKKSLGLAIRQIIVPAYVDYSLHEGTIIRFHKNQDLKEFIEHFPEFLFNIGSDEVNFMTKFRLK